MTPGLHSAPSGQRLKLNSQRDWMYRDVSRLHRARETFDSITPPPPVSPVSLQLFLSQKHKMYISVCVSCFRLCSTASLTLRRSTWTNTNTTRYKQQQLVSLLNSAERNTH